MSIELFDDKKNCCACGACMNICPKSAISMKADEYGFLYPQINTDLCIECGMCKKVCSYQNKTESNSPLKVYAAVTKSTDISKSASGGIFAAIAQKIIEDGGIVFGASMEYKNGALTPVHIGVETKDELIKLMGSKYVQSSIANTYKELKSELNKKRKVLYSGTPCQIAGLKGYLQKDYENLYTVDIVCHGVPSAQFFSDYINNLENKLKGKIIDFKFRDKNVGWGHTAKVTYICNQKEKYKWIPNGESSYFSSFLNTDIDRENCYSCKYANSHRPGDISLGDYWGIEKMHPEYLVQNGGFIKVQDGSSCIIANTQKGLTLIDLCKDRIAYKESEFEKAAKGNGQLNRPSKRGKDRGLIMDAYKNGGYEAVEKVFIKRNLVKIIEAKAKYNVKRVLHKLKLR